MFKASEVLLPLGNGNKFASVSRFMGETIIHIRLYYTAGGVKPRPTRFGATLNKQEFLSLIKASTAILQEYDRLQTDADKEVDVPIVDSTDNATGGDWLPCPNLDDDNFPNILADYYTKLTDETQTDVSPQDVMSYHTDDLTPAESYQTVDYTPAPYYQSYGSNYADLTSVKTEVPYYPDVNAVVPNFINTTQLPTGYPDYSDEPNLATVSYSTEERDTAAVMKHETFVTKAKQLRQPVLKRSHADSPIPSMTRPKMNKPDDVQKPVGDFQFKQPKVPMVKRQNRRKTSVL